jgi:hypothetical protein
MIGVTARMQSDGYGINDLHLAHLQGLVTYLIVHERGNSFVAPAEPVLGWAAKLPSGLLRVFARDSLTINNATGNHHYRSVHRA